MLRVLKKHWGYDAFRPMQAEIIRSVLDGHDTLGLMATGGGKSITFQVPAMLIDGLTIVVTPLISLMIGEQMQQVLTDFTAWLDENFPLLSTPVTLFQLKQFLFAPSKRFLPQYITNVIVLKLLINEEMQYAISQLLNCYSPQVYEYQNYVL